jgi:hypothetical protein
VAKRKGLLRAAPAGATTRARGVRRHAKGAHPMGRGAEPRQEHRRGTGAAPGARPVDVGLSREEAKRRSGVNAPRKSRRGTASLTSARSAVTKPRGNVRGGREPGRGPTGAKGTPRGAGLATGGGARRPRRATPSTAVATQGAKPRGRSRAAGTGRKKPTPRGRR